MNIKKFSIALFLLLGLTGCSQYNKQYIPRGCRKDCRYIKEDIYESRSATIFVHGTLYPGIDLLIHALDCPLGLVPAKVQGPKYIHGRIGYLLSEHGPEQFSLDSFYLFGWSGRFSFDARKRAARQLYHSLKHFTGPITVIGHSHGANIGLLLAEVAAENGDTDFSVDRLVLMACPVQDVTKHLVKSPVFKKVVSFYSPGDFDQTKDPQFFYEITRDYMAKTGKKVPILSGRMFDPSPNLIQRRILLGRRNIQHLEYIYTAFLTRLPAVLDLIDKSVKRKQLNDHDHEYMINVPMDESAPPELLVSRRIKLFYLSLYFCFF